MSVVEVYAAPRRELIVVVVVVVVECMASTEDPPRQPQALVANGSAQMKLCG
jgi:hypothetical protein